MQIGVLSKNQEFWATTEIMKALKEKNVRPAYVKTPEVHLILGANIDAVYEKKSLTELDILIPRIGRSLTQLGVMLLRHLELMNVPSTLSREGLVTARNKYLTLQALYAAGVRIPESVLIASRSKSEEPTDYLSPPLVMKLLSGTQGIGVMRVRDAKEAGPIIDTLSELDQMICLQKFLPNPGEDIRIFLAGGTVVAAMKRKAAPNEWRSNIHIGGHGIAHKPSNKETEEAINAAKAVGVEIAGVDLISVENQPYVIEVNASPGFRGLLEATGINAAAAIADYAVEYARH
ncbi:MAG TPA: RimK family alpha-L-glutamate ligase [Candidatus Acidoferrales bacterium]|nr:RimK family alpha-L-glutamate ligase [Candidatus Acidoferrales bacterium]